MNRLNLLKSLAPGFLPLVVFIVADSIWGTRIGLLTAIGFGIIEFIFSYVKEKIIDRFILVDMGLIVVLGMISILLENEIFFKLKPAIIEFIFCAVLGVSIYSPTNIILLMSRRYMKNVPMDDRVLKQFNRSMKVMFFLFLGHTGLIVYSAFLMSKQAWAFISGGLFYLLFGVFLLFEWIRNRVQKRKWLTRYRDEEWFDLVDEEGRIQGRAPRSICHSRPGLLHPVVHVHVLDEKDRLFLQKRSLKKDIQPGKWDTAVGGHMSSNEKVEEALKREAEEELGIRGFTAHFVSRYVWETDVESELVFMFYTRTKSAITINTDEIDEGKFWKIKKVKENIGKNLFTPNFEYEFKLLTEHVFNRSTGT
jgi:isopentenyldiphosphate isomerase/intracellular septation protein A